MNCEVHVSVSILFWNAGRNCPEAKGFTALQTEIIKYLINENPFSFICLQEVNTNVLEKKLPGLNIYPNAACKIAIVKGPEIHEDVHGGYVSQQKSGHDDLVRYVEVEFERFVIISIHGCHKGSTKDAKIKALKDFFTDKLEKYSDKKPVFIAGDFNLTIYEVCDAKNQMNEQGKIFIRRPPAAAKRDREIDFIVILLKCSKMPCPSPREYKVDETTHIIAKIKDKCIREDLNKYDDQCKILEEEIKKKIEMLQKIKCSTIYEKEKNKDKEISNKETKLEDCKLEDCEKKYQEITTSLSEEFDRAELEYDDVLKQVQSEIKGERIDRLVNCFDHNPILQNFEVNVNPCDYVYLGFTNSLYL